MSGFGRAFLRMDTALIVACLVMGGLVYREARVPYGIDGEPEAVTATSPAPFHSVVSAIPVLPERTAFGETLARPLFDATRRPPAPSATAPRALAKTPDPPPVTLTGVILDTGRRIAVLKRSDGKGTIRVAEGQPLDGWIVTEVARSRIVLTRDGQAAILLLTFDTTATGSPKRPMVEPTRAHTGQMGDPPAHAVDGKTGDDTDSKAHPIR